MQTRQLVMCQSSEYSNCRNPELNTYKLIQPESDMLIVETCINKHFNIVSDVGGPCSQQGMFNIEIKLSNISLN